MRKLFLSLAILIGTAMVATSSMGAQTRSSTGSARLLPVNQSGVEGRISFMDTGSDKNGLIISGTATGLDPNEVYFSLIYDNAPVPGGQPTCNLDDNLFDFEEEFAGRWSVDPDGTGTLFINKVSSSYVPLSRIDSVSIVRQEGERPPESFELVACGKVTRHR